jgi:hypothetical protein
MGFAARLDRCTGCDAAMTPLGFQEELALERLAITEHEQEADDLWRQGRYDRAWQERCAASAARQRVKELENENR